MTQDTSCTQPDTAFRRLAVVIELLNCHGPRLEKLVFCNAAEKAISGTAQKSGTNLPKNRSTSRNQQFQSLKSG